MDLFRFHSSVLIPAPLHSGSSVTLQSSSGFPKHHKQSTQMCMGTLYCLTSSWADPGGKCRQEWRQLLVAIIAALQTIMVLKCSSKVWMCVLFICCLPVNTMISISDCVQITWLKEPQDELTGFLHFLYKTVLPVWLWQCRLEWGKLIFLPVLQCFRFLVPNCCTIFYLLKNYAYEASFPFLIQPPRNPVLYT